MNDINPKPIVGVAFQPFDGTNFVSFEQRYRLLCLSKGHGLIFDDPPAGGAALAAYNLADNKARGDLGQLVLPTFLPLVFQAETTLDALAALQDVFNTNSAATIDLVSQQMENLRLKDDEKINDLVMRSKLLRDRLAAAGRDIAPAELARKVLRALPPDYENYRAIQLYQLRGIDNPLTLDGLLPSLLTAEQTVLATKSSRPKAFYSGGNDGRSNGGRDNGRGNFDRRKASSNSDKRCHYCHLKGHLIKDCFKLKNQQAAGGAGGRLHLANGGAGGNTSNNGGGANRDNLSRAPRPFALSAPLIARSCRALTSSAPSSPADSAWVIDSGATYHVTGNRSLFSSYIPHPSNENQNENKKGCSVVDASGHEFDVAGSGDVTISDSLVLRDVIYAPGCAFNLLSGSRVAAAGCALTLDEYGCVIRRPGGDILAQIPQDEDGLYRLAPSVPYALTCTVPSATQQPGGKPAASGGVETPTAGDGINKPPAVTAALWHKRLAHLGKDNLIKVSTMTTGIDLPAAELKELDVTLCDPCLSAKAHRAPFGPADNKASKTLEIVSTDLAGPLPVTKSGFKYFMTTYDNFTGLSLVNVLKEKSEVASTLIDNLNWLENQSSFKVRYVRSDNGSEFVNSTTENFFKLKGIEHQKTVPYTPQQNGAAERLNRTIKEKANAMLFEANLSIDFWPDAVETASFIRNRSPVTNKDATPFELFFNKKPDLSTLRVFGSRTLMLNNASRNKLDPHVKTGILIGYAQDGAAYRIVLPSGYETIARASECVVDESTFGSAALNDISTTTNMTTVPSGGIVLEEGDDESPGPEPETEDRRYPARTTRGPAATPYYIVNPGDATALAVKTTNAPPTTYEAAVAAADAADWQISMEDEYASLIANDVFEVTTLPAREKSLPLKWIYTYKHDSNGNYIRHKARVVVKGFYQREGVDFDEVFAPVGKYTTLRALLSTVAFHDSELHQIDIKTAFLNGKLNETVYVQPPPGFEMPGKVWLLKRALYGLRQAPRAWHQTLKIELEGLGYRESMADPSLFLGNNVALLIYVDDILIAAPTIAEIKTVKDQLLGKFEARDMGDASLFLNMMIHRDRTNRTIKLSQRRAIEELINNYNMSDGKTKPTPLGSTKLFKDPESQLLDTEACPYSALIGSLNYLAVCTRPDISQAVGALSKYMAKPLVSHWSAAKHVLRYLAGTLDYGINYGGDKLGLVGYCDADYGSDPDSRRSTTGYVFMLNGGAISWASRLQKTVAASTTEAEYMSESAAIKEALWLKTLLTDFGYDFSSIYMFADNQAAIKLMTNPIISQRSKHIDIAYHFARQHVIAGTITLGYIPTEQMVADVFTKPVPESKHMWCCKGMGLF